MMISKAESNIEQKTCYMDTFSKKNDIEVDSWNKPRTVIWTHK